jgi:hypothetical protein
MVAPITFGPGIRLGAGVTAGTSTGGGGFTISLADITLPDIFYGLGGYSGSGSWNINVPWTGGYAGSIADAIFFGPASPGVLAQWEAAWASAGYDTNYSYAWNATWGNPLNIATNIDGGLVGWGPYGTALSVAANPVILSTYPVGSTITWQDNTTATIVQIDDNGSYYDIFWDTPKTGDLFPMTLSKTGVVRMRLLPGASPGNQVFIVPVDTTFPTWQTTTPNQVPAVQGVFTLPVTLTPYVPTTQLSDQNDWC